MSVSEIADHFYLPPQKVSNIIYDFKNGTIREPRCRNKFQSIEMKTESKRTGRRTKWTQEQREQIIIERFGAFDASREPLLQTKKISEKLGIPVKYVEKVIFNFRISGEMHSGYVIKADQAKEPEETRSWHSIIQQA